MKQQFLFAAAAIAAMGLASCSNENAYDGIVEGQQVLNLAVTSTGDNFGGTRADRHLYSAKSDQDIENVKVIIVNDQKQVVADKLFTDWMNGGVSSQYDNSTFGHGRQASWSLSGNKLIPGGTKCTAWAVGYNTGNYNGLTDFIDNYKFTPATQTSAAVTPTATLPLMVTVPTGKEKEVKEIFAGASKEEFTVANNSTNNVTNFSFNEKLTLHRQVAGALGYFKNIPVVGNADHPFAKGLKLRLVASAQNNSMVFDNFNSDFTGTAAPAASGVATDAKYVVNGYNPAAADAYFYTDAANYAKTSTGAADYNAYIVYEINLTQWFTDDAAWEDGILNANDADYFTNPLYVASVTGAKNNEHGKGTPTVASCSVLGGKFVIPFAAVKDKATFQLQLIGDEYGTKVENGKTVADKSKVTNNVIIRYWNIRLQKDDTTTDSQIDETAKVVTVTTANNVATAAWGDHSMKENAVNYSVLRNHIYSIGKRLPKTGGDPDDPDEPGTDPDEPQDLSNENLVIRVNDNWEGIHEMDVD